MGQLIHCQCLALLLAFISLAQGEVNITAYNGSSVAGAKATISCKIVATTTVSYDGQYFIAGDAGNDLLAFATHAGNTTFKVTWDDTNKILTMEVEKSPSEKVNEYTCFINSTESSVTTQHSAKPYINTIGVEAIAPYVISGTQAVIQYSLYGTALEPSVTFERATVKWTTESTDGNYTVGEGESGDPRVVNLTISSDMVSAAMVKLFTCLIALNDSGTITALTATSTLTVLEYQVNPQKAGFVEEVGSSITCSPPITPFASTVLWFKNVSSDGTAEVAVGANVNKTLVRTFVGNASTETGTYYCNSTYPADSASGFAGGQLVSNKANVTVEEITRYSDNCVYRNCTFTDNVLSNCFGFFYALSTACAYDATGKNNMKIHCGSKSGCAGITDTTNYIYFYGIGDGSTAVSKMDYAVNHWINGSTTSITSTDSSSSNFQIHCPLATQASETCKITTTGAKMSTSVCTGPWCEVNTIGCGTTTTATCTGAQCGVNDQVSNYTIARCTGNNCTTTVNGGYEGSAYCNNVGCQILITNSTALSAAYALGDYSLVNVTATNQTKPICKGDYCIAIVNGGQYSTPECQGFACHAHGIKITNTGTNNIKVKCSSRDCVATCTDSHNCTAYCEGPFCKAICNITTGIGTCQATCNGTYCTATCVEGSGEDCKTLVLPKRSPCENCLTVPQIWDWKTCGPIFPRCQTCYAAQYDLLGITLYRVGCDDNTTYTDPPCVNNTYMQACYVDYCSNDYCSNTLVTKYMNSAVRALLPSLSVIVSALCCHPIFSSVIVSGVCYIGGVMKLGLGT